MTNPLVHEGLFLKQRKQEPKMEPLIIPLTKMSLYISETRKPLQQSYPFLRRLNKYCSEMDRYPEEDLIKVISEHPLPLKAMHVWTEALLRTCLLYDHLGDDDRRRYLQRIRRHGELVLQLYMESKVLTEQWDYMYMYATTELFIFQIEWKRLGISPTILSSIIRTELDGFKAYLPGQPVITISYPYAKDLIDLDTYQFFN
jgi:hypothetical protein